MRRHYGKILLLLLAVIFFGAAIQRVCHVRRTVLKTLAEERARLIDKNKIPFEKKVLTPYTGDDASVIINASPITGMAELDGAIYTSTGGGLVKYAPNGRIVRHYTVLDGLPESSLTAIVAFGGRLFIGTHSSGLIAFDGKEFMNYELSDREIRGIHLLSADNGILNIGTTNGGLLQFDGINFTELEAGPDMINSATCILRDGNDLIIGTFADGLFLGTENSWSKITTAEGLPSERVTGLAALHGKIYVATDLGLAVVSKDNAQQVLSLPTLSGIVAFNDRIYLTNAQGEVFAFERTSSRLMEGGGFGESQFGAFDNSLWQFSGGRIRKVAGNSFIKFEAPTMHLPDNFISSMTFDRLDNLWIGTFRNGIGIMDKHGRSLKIIGNDAISYINYLAQEDDSVTAATSAGVISFRNKGAVSRTITKATGLPSNTVMQFKNGVIATAAGVAFINNNKIRYITAIQGLPNNSVYSLFRSQEKIYAGTLGGLAEIEDQRVVRTYTDQNSGLMVNWVTAIYGSADRIFIGTYGGGIYELMPSGDIRSFEPEIGKFVVNFNALYSDGERLFAGTLEGVWYLDLDSQQWKKLDVQLPAQTVMSITGNESAIYFGTSAGITVIGKRHFMGEAQ